MIVGTKREEKALDISDEKTRHIRSCDWCSEEYGHSKGIRCQIMKKLHLKYLYAVEAVDRERSGRAQRTPS